MHKIRYDLIEKNLDGRINYTEQQLINHYNDLLLDCKELDYGINSYMINVSPRSHRLGFLMQDLKGKNDPQIFVVTPYLHERRIYIARAALGNQYFYTTVETATQALKQYNETILRKSLKAKVQSILTSPGAASSLETKIEDDQENTALEKFTCLLRINLTESKYYVYAQNGILLRRVVFFREK